MRSSLSDPDSPSTLNFQGVTVSPILTERAGDAADCRTVGDGSFAERTESRPAHQRVQLNLEEGSDRLLDLGPLRMEEINVTSVTNDLTTQPTNKAIPV